MASTGLRISEALARQLSDVTLDGLVIRETKLRKSRMVALHATIRDALERSLAARRKESTPTGVNSCSPPDGRHPAGAQPPPSASSQRRLACGRAAGHSGRHPTRCGIIPSPGLFRVGLNRFAVLVA